MKGILTVIGARSFCISEVHFDNIFRLLFCHVEIVIQAHGILLLFFGSQFGIDIHDHTKVDMRNMMYTYAAHLYGLLHYYLHYFEELAKDETNQLNENIYMQDQVIQYEMKQLQFIQYQPYSKKDKIVVAHNVFLKNISTVQNAVDHLMNIKLFVMKKQLQIVQTTDELHPVISLDDSAVMAYVSSLCSELSSALDVLETYCKQFEKMDAQFDFTEYKKAMLAGEEKTIPAAPMKIDKIQTNEVFTTINQ